MEYNLKKCAVLFGRSGAIRRTRFWPTIKVNGGKSRLKLISSSSSCTHCRKGAPLFSHVNISQQVRGTCSNPKCGLGRYIYGYISRNEMMNRPINYFRTVGGMSPTSVYMCCVVLCNDNNNDDRGVGCLQNALHSSTTTTSSFVAPIEREKNLIYNDGFLHDGVKQLVKYSLPRGEK